MKSGVEPATKTNDETETFDWGDEYATFGDRLARAREFAGMKQSELAERLGVKVSTIRNWESDRSEPRANRLQMLCGLLNISIIWLMSGVGAGIHEDADDPKRELANLLAELGEVRAAQLRLAERTGQLEKRLRAAVSAC